MAGLMEAAKDRIAAVFGAGIEANYKLDVRVFGKNATMGPLEPETCDRPRSRALVPGDRRDARLRPRS